MRTADSRSVLTILASILLLAPQLAASYIDEESFSCSVWFDANPIVQGQGTYLRWSTNEWNSVGDAGWYSWMQINNIGTVLPRGIYMSPRAGQVWVSPSQTTDYSGAFYDVYQRHTVPIRCPATLSVVPAATPTAVAPPPPSCSVIFDQNPINKGRGTTIRWSSTSAQLFYINAVGYVGGSGSASVAPSGTIDYSGYVNNKADGTGDTAACAATLVVSGGQCPPGQILRDDGTCVAHCPVGYVQQGNQCVFSACPSGYVKQGTQCVRSNLCTTPPHCSGNDLINSCTGALIRSCDWGCAGSSCNPVPTPSATLKATPTLLRAGNTTVVSWTSENVSSCSVHGTNGDSWTGKSSTGKTSKTIQSQTTFNLHCVGSVGSSPATIDKSVIVNIIPSFNEK